MKQPLVFDGSASPVKTALFVIICFAWLIPGLIGHDPWKPDEAMAMGIVQSMLNGVDAWLIPQIAGVINTEYPPLYYWLATASAKLLAFAVPAHDGARLASGLFMFVTIFYLYKSANKLFDERAGRIAVALLIGSLGLLLRAHELNPEVAGMTGMSIALYGLTRIRFEARKGITVGVGALVMALSVGLLPALVVPTIALVMMSLLHDWQNRAFARGIVICLAVLLVGASIYPLILFSKGLLSNAILIDSVLGAPMLDANLRNTIEPLYFVKILPWYALPTLPLALWLWRKDRKIIRERIELVLPLSAFVVSLVWLSLFREARDAVALTLLLPLALAAAHSLDRLPKGAASFIDWFGLVVFGTAALALWLYWTAAVVGAPDAAARAVARAAPGFTFSFSWLPVIIAVILTGMWIYAVAMAHRNNRRAVVNWAAGITLLWVLLSLLGLPAVDHV
ncbi:MAG: glycosyltransferase family 39 protein, partial [Pseudomonadota bacterium]